jgi:hypothetical protein
MESSIFWEIRLCSLLKVIQRFGEKCCLHLQDRKIGQERNQHEAGSKQSGLDGVISRKIRLFITTSARTSKPT